MKSLDFLLGHSGRKFLYATLFIASLIIGGVTAALVMLRQEAVETHLKIASLHAKTFSDHLAQTIYSINLSIDNSSTLFENIEDKESINELLNNMLLGAPYVRSYTLLDESNTTIASSNKRNIGVHVSLNDFLPIPFLDEPILRFGKSWKGRDISDVEDVIRTSEIKSGDNSFIPLLKEIKVRDKKYFALVALNGDFFVNRYAQSLQYGDGFVDVVRMDGVLLFSTDENSSAGSKQEGLATLFSEGKDSISTTLLYKNRQSLVAYQLLPSSPISVVVRLDYESSLKNWERQRINVLLITATLVIISAILALLLIIRHKKQQMMEAQILKSKISSMGELVSMIAHQWRQPLQALSALSSDVVMAYEYGELTKEYLDDMKKENTEILEYLSDTIDNFRSFFVPQSSKINFCLCESISSAVGLMLETMKTEQIDLYFNGKLISDHSEVSCHNKYIVSGFQNEFIHALIFILKNSQEAIQNTKPKNASIQIELHEINNKYILAISDNGGGIPNEIENKIFEPYFTTKHSSIGVGMSLFVVEMLIEKNMDGQINFENKNSGASFVIELEKIDLSQGENNA